MYLSSFIYNPKLTLKFGYLWFFNQPSKDNYATCILRMLSVTELLIQQFLKNEGLSNSAIGYRPETMIAVLKNDADFSDFRRQIDFSKNPHSYLDRRENPEEFV